MAGNHDGATGPNRSQQARKTAIGVGSRDSHEVVILPTFDGGPQALGSFSQQPNTAPAESAAKALQQAFNAGDAAAMKAHFADKIVFIGATKDGTHAEDTTGLLPTAFIKTGEYMLELGFPGSGLDDVILFVLREVGGKWQVVAHWADY